MSELQNLSNAVNGRPPSDITICFDLDGVICENNSGDYKNAKPIWRAIENVNRIYDMGYHVIIFTARFGKRFPGKQYQLGFELTMNWLRMHKVKFHELHMGKPHYDLMVDDKGCRVNGSNNEDWKTVLKLISELHKKNQYGELLNG